MANSFDRHPYLKTPNCPSFEEKKKLTFDEWLAKNYGIHADLTTFETQIAKRAWEAGQDNK